ncbi:hypothetical protein AB8O38_17045 [Saccharomonospora xinjiangensis]|uniref:hypothetical protein n=1 Tax=Saccharomonospora xinjiangensis TaxID=75294 RepID=UPI00350FF6E5
MEDAALLVGGQRFDEEVLDTIAGRGQGRQCGEAGGPSVVASPFQVSQRGVIMAVLLVATACYALLLPRSVSVATAGGVRARVADDRRG